MKNISLKIVLAIATFLLGILSVWSFLVLEEITATLRKELPINPDSIVETQPTQELQIPTSRTIKFKNGTGSIEVSSGDTSRFFPYGRGCGNGYSQSYVTNEGDFMSEGVEKFSKKQFNEYLKEIEIIDRVKNAKNRDGELGLRIVTKGHNKKGLLYFEIIWYGAGWLHYIEAPTLELALEFEKANAYAY